MADREQVDLRERAARDDPGGARIALHEQRDLLAAVARDEIRAARVARDHPRDRDQHVVAGRVTVAVIDALEVVEIEEHERDAAAIALHALELERERLAEQLGAIQPGQAIPERAPLEPARLDREQPREKPRGAARRGNRKAHREGERQDQRDRGHEHADRADAREHRRAGEQRSGCRRLDEVRDARECRH